MAIAIPDRKMVVRAGYPGGAGQTWTTIHMEAEVESVHGSTPNKAVVKLWNISPTSLKFLKQPNLVLQIMAGQGVASSIFYGDIDKRGIKTTRQGPDQITEIHAKDGGRIIRDAFFTGSYPPGTTRSQILTDVLAKAGLSRGFVDPSITERTYPGPMAWAAPVRNVLHELYAPEGALWSIQGGVLQVMALGTPLPGTAVLVSSGTGLRGSPTPTDKGGVEVIMVMNPAIKPGTSLSVKSSIVSGAFKATKVTQSIHSTGLTWDSKIQGRPIK